MRDHPLSWMRRALCAVGGMPADAWTERPGDRQWGSTSDHKAAIRICKRCPVQVDCLEYALALEANEGRSGRSGIYGGMTPPQRLKIQQQRDKKKGRTSA